MNRQNIIPTSEKDTLHLLQTSGFIGRLILTEGAMVTRQLSLLYNPA